MSVDWKSRGWIGSHRLVTRQNLRTRLAQIASTKTVATSVTRNFSSLPGLFWRAPHWQLAFLDWSRFFDRCHFVRSTAIGWIHT